ncbi:MAG: putative terminase large subunit [Prokaryotic dsDNA virus sp.]|nr:MAG: putative terminase large subunit [Prokaryotic dsDNA virus sp.]
MSKRTYTKEEIRVAAENDLATFIKLVAPKRVLGHVHEDLIQWWCREGAHTHQLVLLPRGHQKSAMIAYRVAWEITRNPATTILYASATAGLAEQQLKMIKDILTSPIYRRYWPEMVNQSEGARERWTTGEIAVDHPLRKEEGVRDPTVKTAGLSTNIVGFHCDVFVLDDIVTSDNAYTEENRDDVKRAYSFFASIENPDAKEWVVGTRYHPKDLYCDLMDMKEDVYNEEGEIVDSAEVFEIFERQVEDRGDGAGEFIWPRQHRPDGKWFGFNTQVLAKKRAQYLDKTQFRAQYYNDPNDPDNQRISRTQFQYYDQRKIVQKNGRWYYGEQPLSIYASVDFAYSLRKTADYTAIVVIGIDPKGNIYVLEVDRFRTDRISTYWDHISSLHLKWSFRKLRAEATAAQSIVIKEIKDQYLRPSGLTLSIEEHKPNRHMGSKEQRIAQVLESRYDNQAIWHYRGGNCQILEEELVLAHPPHDDVKDALANAVEIAVPPRSMRNKSQSTGRVIVANSRFGGV